VAAGVKRIHILGIPVDVVDDEALPGAIDELCEVRDHRQIVLLNFHELMKARHNRERRDALVQAALVIPVSSLIVRAAGFLRRDVPPLRRSYPFIIRLLGILENKNRSVYLLGSTMKGVRSAESALRATFPGLRIVGRYSSRYPSEREADVVTAIKKASPTLLLAGRGLKGRHLWIARRRSQFSPGLGIWEESCFEVFAGRRSKPNNAAAARLFRGFFGSAIRPWRFLRAFRYLGFFVLLLVERIRSR